MKNTSGYLKTRKKKKMLKDSPKISHVPKSKKAKKRLCLKCGKKFLSRGAYNRVCEKCRLANERMTSCTYSINGIASDNTTASENKFYEMN